jgi:hypothetical protein
MRLRRKEADKLAVEWRRMRCCTVSSMHRRPGGEQITAMVNLVVLGAEAWKDGKSGAMDPGPGARGAHLSAPVVVM